ncbi:MAG: chaperone modulatory protein CbpM [Motiliproteus sp.]|jgi:chaperone modulatory protein CbpM
MNNKQLMVIGELLDERLLLDLREISQCCSVEVALVIEMVQIGVLEPRGLTPADWWFSGRDLLRLQRALRLQQDLGINVPGLALCIELLEERARLTARMRVLEGHR